MHFYYGAGYYPRLSIWYGVDPLAEKYPSISPYAYVANNPIKYIDPDGRDIIIWYKASNGKMQIHNYKYGENYTGKNKYLIAFHKSANILIKAGEGAKLKALEESTSIVKVTDEGYDKKIGPSFSSDEMTIRWKPNIGVDTDGDGDLTPTAVLDHEIDHVLGYVTDPEWYKKRMIPDGTEYDNKEEKRVITGSEQKTAKKLRIISSNETTRKNHRGKLIETAGVSTTKKPEKNKK